MAEPMTSARSQAAMAISHRHPQNHADRLGIVVAAGLGKIAARDDPQLHCQGLQQDRHQIGNHDHGKQGVIEPSSRSQIRCPIPRVHVSHSHHVSWSREGQHLAPEAQRLRHFDGLIHLGQAWRAVRHVESRVDRHVVFLARQAHCGLLGDLRIGFSFRPGGTAFFCRKRLAGNATVFCPLRLVRGWLSALDNPTGNTWMSFAASKPRY